MRRALVVVLTLQACQGTTSSPLDEPGPDTLPNGDIARAEADSPLPLSQEEGQGPEGQGEGGGGRLGGEGEGGEPMETINGRGAEILEPAEEISEAGAETIELVEEIDEPAEEISEPEPDPCALATLAQAFGDNVRGHMPSCSSCHDMTAPSGALKAPGPPWYHPTDDAAVVAYLQEAFLISGFDPAESLFLLKPLDPADGGVAHTGGVWISGGDEAHVAFLAFLDAASPCQPTKKPPTSP